MKVPNVLVKVLGSRGLQKEDFLLRRKSFLLPVTNIPSSQKKIVSSVILDLMRKRETSKEPNQVHYE